MDWSLVDKPFVEQNDISGYYYVYVTLSNGIETKTERLKLRKKPTKDMVGELKDILISKLQQEDIDRQVLSEKLKNESSLLERAKVYLDNGKTWNQILNKIEELK